jgi:1,4-dihydroxy-2-naphthoate octaprenyltransferase
LIYLTGLILFLFTIFLYLRSSFLKKLSFETLRIYLFLHYFFLLSGGYLISIFFKGYKIKNFFEFLINSFSLFVLFQSALILNDYFDKEGDKYIRETNPFFYEYKKKEVIFYFLFFTISSLILSSFSLRIFLVFLFSHILHIIYSVPPIRLKKYFPLNLLILGIAAFFSFMMGFGINLSYKKIPLKIYLLIFLALTPAISFRDLLDFEGDKILGVKTLPTIFGKERGKNYSALLILYSYLIVPLILNFFLLYLISIPLGMLSFFEIKKEKMNQLKIFNYYFLFLFIIIIIFGIKPEILL